MESQATENRDEHDGENRPPLFSRSVKVCLIIFVLVWICLSTLIIIDDRMEKDRLVQKIMIAELRFQAANDRIDNLQRELEEIKQKQVGVE
jgi:hypothetical protein